MSEKTTTAAPEPVEAGRVVSEVNVPYIAGSVEYPYYVADRALPQTIDDAEAKYGFRLYEKMAKEPTLNAGEKTLKILSTNEPPKVMSSHQKPRKKVVPPVLDPGQKATPANVAMGLKRKFATLMTKDPDALANAEAAADYEKSKELADFTTYLLDRLSHNGVPLTNTLWNMLDCIHAGHKLAEVNFEPILEGDFAGKIGIESIRTKPRENYVFILDAQNRLVGVQAKIPGVSLVLRTGIVGDASKINNVIDPDKILNLTLDENDGNPQGKSWFRAPYDPYYRKQLLKPEDLGTAKRFAGGQVTIVAPAAAETTLVSDQKTGKQITLMQSILGAAQDMQNGNIAVFTNGTEVTVHEPTATGAYFQTAYQYCDKEMLTALLLSARSLMEAKHGSKADSESSQDLLDEVVGYIRMRLCEMLQRLVRRVLLLNYPRAIVDKYCPTISMQTAAKPDFAANATAISLLFEAGWIDASQMDQYDVELLGVDPREGVDSTAGSAETSFSGEVKRPRRIGFRPSRRFGAVQKASHRQAVQARAEKLARQLSRK